MLGDTINTGLRHTWRHHQELGYGIFFTYLLLLLFFKFVVGFERRRPTFNVSKTVTLSTGSREPHNDVVRDLGIVHLLPDLPE